MKILLIDIDSTILNLALKKMALFTKKVRNNLTNLKAMIYISNDDRKDRRPYKN